MNAVCVNIKGEVRKRALSRMQLSVKLSSISFYGVISENELFLFCFKITKSCFVQLNAQIQHVVSTSNMHLKTLHKIMRHYKEKKKTLLQIEYLQSNGSFEPWSCHMVHGPDFVKTRMKPCLSLISSNLYLVCLKESQM